MADNKTHLMSQFYQQCQEKGYTDMRDGTQSLKAKVIATDLNLKYKDIAEFYEKARRCYNQIQAENERAEQQRRIQQQKEKEEAARRAVNGELLVTITDSVNASSAQNRVQVFIRPDNSIYCTHNGTNKIEGSPKIGVEKGGVLTMTYHPSQAIYTGATVGGITTGGVHYTKDSYSYNKSNTGKGDVVIEVRGVKFAASIITMSEHTKQLFRRDSAYTGLVAKNGKIECFVQSEKADMYTQVSLLARVDHVTAMNAISMAVDERRLPYNSCVNIANLLGRIVNGKFPPSDEQLYAKAEALSKGSTSAEIKKAADAFRSISDYKDASSRCRALEEKYEEVLQAEKEQAILEKEAQSAKNRKLAMVLIPAIIVGIIALVLVVNICEKSKKNNLYNKALVLMETGQYEEAIDAFKLLEGHKNSDEQIDSCERALLDLQYMEAFALMESGRYEQAISAFESLDGYKESIAQIDVCKYRSALALMTAGKYEDAITAFESLDGYKDSAVQIDACNLAILDLQYNEAVARMDVGDYTSAAIMFGKMGDYKDARMHSMELWDSIAERETVIARSIHTAGLKADGAVVAVGDNSDGQCDVSGWTDIVAISAGLFHTVGLKADGTVVAVGNNEYGQCNVSGWTDIVAISAGGYHAVGLKADGTVVAVGYNDDGRCDVSGWTDIVAISAKSYHTVGLKSDGSVVAVGDNSDGKCDVSGWTDIVAISADLFHTVGLKADGTVVAVGNNKYGQCNVSGWTDIVAISANSANDYDGHTVGLKADGTVVATKFTGEKRYNHGQCEVSEWKDIVAVSTGPHYTVGLKSDGTVVAVGYNGDGRCDVSGWKDILAIRAGDYHTVGLKSDGMVVAVGDNRYGRCDVSGWKNIKLPANANLN